MFIPRTKPKRIKLTKEMETYQGTFTVGHEFSILESSERGFDLVDNEGRRVYECGPFISYEVVEY